MFHYKKIIELPMSIDQVFKFSTDIYNICEMVPDYIKVKVLEGSDSLVSGDKVKLKLNILGISFTWESVVEDYVENEYFSDRMLKGPFKSWEHKHYYKEIAGGTEQTDIVNYELPLGGIGYLANTFIASKMIEDIFTFRRDFFMAKHAKGCKI